MPRKTKDLTGMIFGELIVLEQDLNYVKEHNIKGNPSYWRCKCSCGTILTVRGSHLTEKNGKKKCTKCVHKDLVNDLTGQTFGYLTVLKLLGTVNRKAIFRCQCKCGNLKDVPGIQLTNGITRSCGCLFYEKQLEGRDLIGQKFEKLTVIKRVPKPEDKSGYGTWWLCECECGNKIITRRDYLITGHTKSCGCLKSRGEEKIGKLLIENNIPFEKQKSFKNCQFEDTKAYAYFDFYVNNNFLLEYDGEQHFTYREKGWDNKENFERTKKRDNFKNQWCKENGIILKRIPYWDLDNLTIEDIMGDKYIVS